MYTIKTNRSASFCRVSIYADHQAIKVYWLITIINCYCCWDLVAAHAHMCMMLSAYPHSVWLIRILNDGVSELTKDRMREWCANLYNVQLTAQLTSLALLIFHHICVIKIVLIIFAAYWLALVLTIVLDYKTILF